MMPAVTIPTEDLRSALREMLAAQRRMRGREAQRHDALSYSQSAVLRALTDGEAHSAGELAAASDLTPASMTKMLDGLAAAGLIERVRDEGDRRRLAVRITDAGRAAHEDKDARILAAWDRVLEGAETAEIEAMAVALRRIASLYDAL